MCGERQDTEVTEEAPRTPRELGPALLGALGVSSVFSVSCLSIGLDTCAT
jgi:hypothetical protein